MIVEQIGYIKSEAIMDMLIKGEKFSLYKTHKNTCILVQDTHVMNVELFYVRRDKLPWKITEGKKIISGERIFSSEKESDVLDNSLWNNGNQVIAYRQY